VRGSGKSAFQLQVEASLTAIDDAGLTPKDIDGVIPIGITGAPAEEFVTSFGIPDLRFSALTPLGGASSIAAVQCAAAAIAAGICNHVLIAAGRNAFLGARAGVRIHEMPQFHFVTEFELPLGAIAPAQLYAPMARRHMALYGTTSRQLGEIAVRTRQHALLNGNAIMKKPITIDDHQGSRMIADPFRLLDCSLESDGGAAFVVSAAERARDMRQPPAFIMGGAVGVETRAGLWALADNAYPNGRFRSVGAHLWDTTGVKPADVDVAQFYENFTGTTLMAIADIGFCEPGYVEAFVSDGNLQWPDGGLPLNTSGGNLAEAYIHGFQLINEAVRQVRGQSTCQVANVELSLSVAGPGTPPSSAVLFAKNV
jgi:acetyl-CoA acetyltransferase